MSSGRRLGFSVPEREAMGAHDHGPPEQAGSSAGAGLRGLNHGHCSGIRLMLMAATEQDHHSRQAGPCLEWRLGSVAMTSLFPSW